MGENILPIVLYCFDCVFPSVTVVFDGVDKLAVHSLCIALAAGASRPEESLSEGELKRFGLKLHEIIFVGPVAELFKKTMTEATHADGLRIDLDIQSPKLSRIAWELSHDGTDFLAGINPHNTQAGVFVQSSPSRHARIESFLSIQKRQFFNRRTIT